MKDAPIAIFAALGVFTIATMALLFWWGRKN